VFPAHALKLVLVEPEIPQNAGNIARLCAAAGAELHLVRPLGFILSDRHFKRAGMDYVARIRMVVHDDLSALLGAIGTAPFHLTTGLDSMPARDLWSTRFAANSWILLGKESAGLPGELLARHPGAVVRIPMVAGERGLNVSTAAGIVLYEALRQVAGSAGRGR
jgi:tRNA (cytidine/uridine-2'-O-)-methyltransferase